MAFDHGDSIADGDAAQTEVWKEVRSGAAFDFVLVCLWFPLGFNRARRLKTATVGRVHIGWKHWS